MKPFCQDNHKRIFNGDCRSMSELPDESVQAVVTSPPYWGLRKYSGEQELVWGGDPACQHQWVESAMKHDALRHRPGEHCIIGSEKNPAIHPGNKVVVGFCALCGAWRGALGLEPTLELYLEHSIGLLREIGGVLRADGVVFWNIGDSYWGSGGEHYKGTGFQAEAMRRAGRECAKATERQGHHEILKPKDLCMIPQRLAIALQMDGWWVRSWIIWHKPNVKPESVNGWRWERHKVKVKDNAEYEARLKAEAEKVGRQTAGLHVRQDHGELPIWADCPGCPKCEPNDGYVLRRGSWRPTTAHEYILMLTKSESYFCDAEAAREAYTEPLNRWGGPKLKRETGKMVAYREQVGGMGATSLTRAGRPIRPDATGRNRRSVWTFPTVPFPGAHFAVFPEQLPELCIRVATPDYGVCAKCGAPWARVVEKRRINKSWWAQQGKTVEDVKYLGKYGGKNEVGADFKRKDYDIRLGPTVETTTLGWKPTCHCGIDDRVPATVLDPFMGAGSTLVAAFKLGRQAVGYEISEEYCRLAVERCRRAMEKGRQKALL